MDKPTVGIIGCGFVGGAVARAFGLFVNLKVYDIRKHVRTHTLEDVVNSDYVFLCLPTPMNEDGSCNIDVLEGVCTTISQLPRNEKTVFIHKSTCTIGTTSHLRKQFNMRLIFSPEFLTARNADIDFLTANRNVLGGEAKDVDKVAELFEYRFPKRPIIRMTAEEAEALKYAVNCFLAAKVMFFNEFRLGICEKLGLDYEKILGQIMADGRIAYSHTQVPGHDGDYGFGGACFPKDLNALIHQMEANGFEPKMLKAAWEQNLAIRKKRDW